MASVHGKTGTVTIDDSAGTPRIISADCNSFSIGNVSENADDTAFGDAAHSRIVGLVDTTVSLEGFYNTVALIGSDTVLGPISVAPASQTSYTVAVSADGGTITYTAEMLLNSYTVNDPVDDIVTFSAEFVTADGAATVRS